MAGDPDTVLLVNGMIGSPSSFSDPVETVLLPSRVETMTVWRDAGSPRVLTTQTFENYRRFVTESRIIR